MANQIRIMSFDDVQGGGIAIKSSSSSPSISPPVSVDNRPPALLPMGAKKHARLAPPTSNGNHGGDAYHVIGGSMEGISPPRNGSAPLGIYSSAQDDESVMSNSEYLTMLSQQQVGVGVVLCGGCTAVDTYVHVWSSGQDSERVWFCDR